MKIDIHEMQQIAAVAPPRLDLYATIHKALRACMADALLALGRMDTTDNTEVAAIGTKLGQLLDLCASHLEHENAFIHAAIEARAPGASGTIAGEHVVHCEEIAALRAGVAQLQASEAGSRERVALALYRALALFVGHNFAHMQVEESVHNRALWNHYSDDELAAIHGALVASIPPQEMMQIMRWMVPYMNPAERTLVLADMRRHAPAPAFAAVLDVVRPHLDDTAWAKLARSLQLPCVPGLVAY